MSPHYHLISQGDSSKIFKLAEGEAVGLSFDPSLAVFSRIGTSLNILLENGNEVLVEGYFAKSDNPDLPPFLLEDGVLVSGESFLASIEPDLDLSLAAGPAQFISKEGSSAYADSAGEIISSMSDALGIIETASLSSNILPGKSNFEAYSFHRVDHLASDSIIKIADTEGGQGKPSSEADSLLLFFGSGSNSFNIGSYLSQFNPSGKELKLKLDFGENPSSLSPPIQPAFGVRSTPSPIYPPQQAGKDEDSSEDTFQVIIKLAPEFKSFINIVAPQGSQDIYLELDESFDFSKSFTLSLFLGKDKNQIDLSFADETSLKSFMGLDFSNAFVVLDSGNMHISPEALSLLKELSSGHVDMSVHSSKIYPDLENQPNSFYKAGLYNGSSLETDSDILRFDIENHERSGNDSFINSYGVFASPTDQNISTNSISATKDIFFKIYSNPSGNNNAFGMSIDERASGISENILKAGGKISFTTKGHNAYGLALTKDQDAQYAKNTLVADEISIKVSALSKAYGLYLDTFGGNHTAANEILSRGDVYINISSDSQSSKVLAGIYALGNASNTDQHYNLIESGGEFKINIEQHSHKWNFAKLYGLSTIYEEDGKNLSTPLAQGIDNIIRLTDNADSVSISLKGHALNSLYGLYSSGPGKNIIEDTREAFDGTVTISIEVEGSISNNFALLAESYGKNIINTASGNDILTIAGNIEAKSYGINSIDSGAGSDQFHLKGNIKADNYGENFLNSGNGNDIIKIDGDIIASNSGKNIFDTGSGHDEFVLKGKLSAGAYSENEIKLGSGDDILNIQEGLSAGYLGTNTIIAGEGNDLIIINGNVFSDLYASNIIETGAGKDTIIINGTFSAEYASENIIRTGDGDDIIVLNGFVHNNSLQIEAENISDPENSDSDFLILQADSLYLFEKQYGDFLTDLLTNQGAKHGLKGIYLDSDDQKALAWLGDLVDSTGSNIEIGTGYFDPETNSLVKTDLSLHTNHEDSFFLSATMSEDIQNFFPDNDNALFLNIDEKDINSLDEVSINTSSAEMTNLPIPSGEELFQSYAEHDNGASLIKEAISYYSKNEDASPAIETKGLGQKEIMQSMAKEAISENITPDYDAIRSYDLSTDDTMVDEACQVEIIKSITG